MEMKTKSSTRYNYTFTLRAKIKPGNSEGWSVCGAAGTPCTAGGVNGAAV